MKLKSIINALCCGVLAGGLVVQAARAAAPDSGAIARGAYLARAGDCVACHTAPGGKAFAGGLPMRTPLGTVYSTNISPDAQSGIGAWSERDFERALRRGVARDGHNLYPAMPYPSYAKVSDADVAALYAYFIKAVAPVRQANRTPDIRFPLNMRWPLKLWNLVFLDSTPYRAKPNRTAEWNRGAYLVQGLGHCGACHTPRGAGFQEKGLDETEAAYLAGAEIDGWYASSLRGEQGAGLGRWSAAELKRFLGSGANAHASAYGSMAEVVSNSTQYFSERDLSSIAAFLRALPASAPASNPGSTGVASVNGGRVYRTYCLQCHGADGRGHAPLLAPLAGNPTVIEPHGPSLVNVVLNGSGERVVGGVPQAYPMPGFGKLLDDRQVADVLSFIRASWNNGAPPVGPQQVAKVRKQGQDAR
jgi:mono/diheme cytochrome c family protein